MEVVWDVGLQGTRAGEEARHQDEQPPAEGAAGSAKMDGWCSKVSW